MPQFHYRAVTQAGEVVVGEAEAPTREEVIRRIEYLGHLPIAGFFTGFEVGPLGAGYGTLQYSGVLALISGLSCQPPQNRLSIAEASARSEIRGRIRKSTPAPAVAPGALH